MRVAVLGVDRRAGRIARVAEHDGARARRERRRDVVPGEAIRSLIGERRFDGDGA